jgi:hypothetical protein
MAPYFFIKPEDLKFVREELDAHRDLLVSKGLRDTQAVLQELRQILEEVDISPGKNANCIPPFIDHCFNEAVNEFCSQYTVELSDRLMQQATDEVNQILLSEKKNLLRDLPMSDASAMKEKILNKISAFMPPEKVLWDSYSWSSSASDNTKRFKEALRDHHAKTTEGPDDPSAQTQCLGPNPS